MLKSERGEISIIVPALLLAVLIMFIGPTIMVAHKKDDVTTLTIQELTDEFVDTIRTTGKITPEQYDNLMQQLVATGNAYNLDITIKVSDDNPAKKGISVNNKTTGETVYYEMYTQQVLDALKNGQVLLLNQGDMVYVTATGASDTTAMSWDQYLFGKKSVSSPTASSGGMVTKSGN